MTDKKTIWHEPTEPVQERFIITIIDEKLYPFFGVYYLDEGSYLTKAQDWSDVEKWCFLDDLLELSNNVERLEKENVELQNALLKHIKIDPDTEFEMQSSKLIEMMSSPKYWKEHDSEYVKKIETGFKKLYGEK